MDEWIANSAIIQCINAFKAFIEHSFIYHTCSLAGYSWVEPGRFWAAARCDFKTMLCNSLKMGKFLLV